jgi:hypothetical protein
VEILLHAVLLLVLPPLVVPPPPVVPVELAVVPVDAPPQLDRISDKISMEKRAVIVARVFRNEVFCKGEHLQKYFRWSEQGYEELIRPRLEQAVGTCTED